MAKLKICLDAGHFANYNRSPVVSQYWESKKMWALHLLLKKHLEQYGIEVITTRTDQNTDFDEYRRGLMAEGCVLFLSLHSNACEHASVDRVEVYAPYDNINNSHTFGKTLALAVAECMGVSTGVVKTRKSEHGERDYYAVMRGARDSGCTRYYIVEHSFHTNKKATQWLLDDNNLDKLARVEAEKIARELGITSKVETKPEPTTNNGVNISLPMLQNGANGASVISLQILLKAYGFKGKDGKVLTIDGAFGTNTDYAVKAFQNSKGIGVDGIVGQDTWNKLVKG